MICSITSFKVYLRTCVTAHKFVVPDNESNMLINWVYSWSAKKSYKEYYAYAIWYALRCVLLNDCKDVTCDMVISMMNAYPAEFVKCFDKRALNVLETNDYTKHAVLNKQVFRVQDIANRMIKDMFAGMNWCVIDDIPYSLWNDNSNYIEVCKYELLNTICKQRIDIKLSDKDAKTLNQTKQHLINIITNAQPFYIDKKDIKQFKRLLTVVLPSMACF